VSPSHPAAAGSPWRPVAIASAVSLGAIGAAAAPRLGLSALVGAVAGGLAAVLAVLALPSFPTRRAAVVMLGIAGLGALRHAALPTTDSILIAVWAAAMLVALVLVDRADSEAQPALPGGRALAARGPEALRAVALVGIVVVAAAVIIVPTATDRLGRKVWPGVLPSFEDGDAAPGSLRSTEQLDMTTRPRLSERVVFTVDAPRPDFWRGEVFDEWDGRRWTRSQPNAFAVSRLGDRWRLPVADHDVAATDGEEMTQTFRVETGFSEVVFAAPSPVEVELPRVVRGRPDGTALVPGGLGRDAVYRVTSRSTLPTAEALRAADDGEVPEDVVSRYAATPRMTDRVAALATAITEDATTTYDKVRAIERWLGTHTRYSLDAPLSPAGADVVDHFLFESRLGWCEQVSSSMVVLARAAGVPARLATGFVPGERDGLSGRFVVRERDAHAWAEIYFAGIGWQGFDPTASVPLAGEASDSGSWMDVARDHAVELALLLALGGWIAVAAPGLIRSWRRRLARRTSWSMRALGRLDRIGRRAGRRRDPSETPREYAHALAAVLEEPRLAEVGTVIDREIFAARGADDRAKDAADAVLAAAEHPRRP
jgi:hypothetical protein